MGAKGKVNFEQLKYLMIVALVLTVGVGVAYAAMSTTLNITVNKVTQNVLTWNVGFDTSGGTSVTATAAGTSATGRSCGNATVAAAAVTVADTTLSKPGDKCTWALTIKNSGTIAASLASITPTKPTSTTCGTATGGNMVCGNITYKLASNTSGTVLATGGTLAVNGTLPVYLIAEYTGTNVNSSAVTQSGAKFAINYTQA